MEELLDAHTDLELGISDLVVSVTLPAARSGEVFWSHRVRSKPLMRLLHMHASCSISLFSVSWRQECYVVIKRVLRSGHNKLVVAHCLLSFIQKLSRQCASLCFATHTAKDVPFQ